MSVSTFFYFHLVLPFFFLLLSASDAVLLCKNGIERNELFVFLSVSTDTKRREYGTEG